MAVFMLARKIIAVQILAKVKHWVCPDNNSLKTLSCHHSNELTTATTILEISFKLLKIWQDNFLQYWLVERWEGGRKPSQASNCLWWSWRHRKYIFYHITNSCCFGGKIEWPHTTGGYYSELWWKVNSLGHKTYNWWKWTLKGLWHPMNNLSNVSSKTHICPGLDTSHICGWGGIICILIVPSC